MQFLVSTPGASHGWKVRSAHTALRCQTPPVIGRFVVSSGVRRPPTRGWLLGAPLGGLNQRVESDGVIA